MNDRVFLEALEPRLMLSADLGTVSAAFLNADGDSQYELPLNPLGDALAESEQPASASETEQYPMGQSLSSLVNPALDFDYVVITNEYLRDLTGLDYTMDDFVQRKEANGYATTVVTVEDIYANYTGVDNQEQIRNFIRDAYDNWGIEYVLLGGNADVIPVRQVVNDAAGNPWIATDMYYQCLDGSWNGDGDGTWGESHDGEGGGEIDMVSEVYIGRAVMSTATELSNWVYKTLAYEDKAADAYRHQALMVGEYTGFGGTYANWGKYCMDKLITGSDKGGFHTDGFNADPTFTVDTLYAYDQGWGASDILGKINTDQYGIYNHLGHGDGGVVMIANSSQYEATMTNENPFFLYSQACWSGYYTTSGALVESLLTHTRTGAAAMVLNSNYGWGVWEDGTDGSSQRVNREFWDAAFGEGIYTLGAMNADSHEDLLWNIGHPQVRSVILDTTLFGDPSLEIFATNMMFLTDADLPTAHDGEVYEQQIDVIYNDGTLVYSITDGVLPDGVVMDANGLLTGTATELGEFDFTVSVTDSSTSEVITKVFSLTVTEVLTFDVPTDLPQAYRNAAYYAPLTVVGGSGPYTWEITDGSLPDGLTFDSETGMISGTPTVTGDFSITVQVTDSDSFAQVISETFDLSVANLLPGFYGQIFEDTNGNGVRDAGEIGLDGHTVSLIDMTTGQVVATAVSASVDVDGNGTIDLETERGLYSIEDVAAGRYILQQDAMTGWEGTTTFQSDQRTFMLRNEGGISTIYEIDAADFTVLASFAAPTNISTPIFGGLAVGPESLFYVDSSNTSVSTTVYELDLETGAVLDVHSLSNLTPAAVMGMAYLDGSLYLMDAAHGFVVYDLGTETLGATIPFAGGFTGGLTGASDRGTLFVSGSTGMTFEIDPANGSILNTLEPYAGVLSGGLAYVDGVLLGSLNVLDGVGTMMRIDATTGQSISLAETGGGATVSGLAGDALPALTVGSYRVDMNGVTAMVDMNFGAASTQPADFDHDGDVDADDIDLLVANFGNPAFDLTGEGTTDVGDVDHLLATVFGTIRGDINLDGKVGILDLGALGDNYATAGGWAKGDLNCDGVVGILDLGILGDNYGFDNSQALRVSYAKADPVILSSDDLTVIDVSETQPIVAESRTTMDPLATSNPVGLGQSLATDDGAMVRLGEDLRLAGASDGEFDVASEEKVAVVLSDSVELTGLQAISDVSVMGGHDESSERPVENGGRVAVTEDEDTVDILLMADLVTMV